MKPTFSEFSYGFALTHELCNIWFGQLKAAPVFPSLIEEGTSGGGYDLHMKKPGTPLFLQFKICQRMVRKTAGEWRLFHQPYYRFWLHARRHSSQHQALLDRDISPNLVLYAAPAIHEVEELNTSFLNGTVVANSVFLRPGVIGPLPDDEPHCVAFLVGQPTGFLCSEPRAVERFAFGSEVAEKLQAAIADVGLSLPTTELFEKIASDVEALVERPHEDVALRFGATESPLRRSQQRAAFAVRTILGAELLWVADYSAPVA